MVGSLESPKLQSLVSTSCLHTTVFILCVLISMPRSALAAMLRWCQENVTSSCRRPLSRRKAFIPMVAPLRPGQKAIGSLKSHCKPGSRIFFKKLRISASTKSFLQLSDFEQAEFLTSK